MHSRLLLAILLACGTATAPVGAMAQVFVGGSIGQSRADLLCAGNSSCDKNGAAFKVTTGYMLWQEVGVEATYFRQGKARLESTAGGTTVTEYRGQGVAVFGVAAAPFTDSFSLIGKVGIVYAKTRRNASSSVAGSSSGSERSTDLAWGVGLGYELTPSLGARLESERMRLRYIGEKSDVDLIMVSLLYRF